MFYHFLLAYFYVIHDHAPTTMTIFKHIKNCKNVCVAVRNGMQVKFGHEAALMLCCGFAILGQGSMVKTLDDAHSIMSFWMLC